MRCLVPERDKDMANVLVGQCCRTVHFMVSLAAALGCSCGALPAAIGAETASAVMLYHQVNANTLRFNIDLTDTGTTNIGTLWYGWVPGEDFIGQAPTNIQSPAGWTFNLTHEGTGDGYAVQWIAGSGVHLSAGQTLTGFSFDTTNTVNQLSGNSPDFPSMPVGTTFVYGGQPFSDSGDEFQIKPTAHPWQNPVSPLDVDVSGNVVPEDALLVIHALVLEGPHALGVPSLSDAPAFIDVNGDGELSAADALQVIHFLVTGSADTVQSDAVPLFASESALPALVSIPEPASNVLALLGAGLALAATRRQRKRSRHGQQKGRN
ncbi:MAG TPA: dockerin type I domain-containing protein [Pirellulales bacterium]|nr:dockerin type I domain-containing protein [Pirellulales bacterium]